MGLDFLHTVGVPGSNPGVPTTKSQITQRKRWVFCWVYGHVDGPLPRWDPRSARMFVSREQVPRQYAPPHITVAGRPHPPTPSP